jgi:hypothetical protein
MRHEKLHGDITFFASSTVEVVDFAVQNVSLPWEQFSTYNQDRKWAEICCCCISSILKSHWVEERKNLVANFKHFVDSKMGQPKYQIWEGTCKFMMNNSPH